MAWAKLFKGRLMLNPGLNLTWVSFSFVEKHFLGQLSLIFIEHPIINLFTKRIKLNLRYKCSYLNSNCALTLDCLNPALNNPAQDFSFHKQKISHILATGQNCSNCKQQLLQYFFRWEQQRKNAFSLGLLLSFLNHFFLPLSFLLVLMLYYLCSCFVHGKVFSVDENRTREKLLIWRRMPASFKYGLCLPLLRSVRCYKFYVPLFFHWKRNSLSMPHKKKTHTHTLEASAHCSHIVGTQYFGWHDLTLLDLTANFQHQAKRKLTLSRDNKQTNKLMIFSPNNIIIQLSKWSLNK